MSKPFRLLLIGDSDSQLLACEALCRFPDQAQRCGHHQCHSQEKAPRKEILKRAQELGTLWRFEMGAAADSPSTSAI